MSVNGSVIDNQEGIEDAIEGLTTDPQDRLRLERIGTLVGTQTSPHSPALPFEPFAGLRSVDRNPRTLRNFRKSPSRRQWVYQVHWRIRTPSGAPTAKLLVLQSAEYQPSTQKSCEMAAKAEQIWIS